MKNIHLGTTFLSVILYHSTAMFVPFQHGSIFHFIYSDYFSQKPASAQFPIRKFNKQFLNVKLIYFYLTFSITSNVIIIATFIAFLRSYFQARSSNYTDSLVPPTLNLIAKSRHVMYTEGNYRYSLWIPLLRRNFHANRFFQGNDALRNRLLRGCSPVCYNLKPFKSTINRFLSRIPTELYLMPLILPLIHKPPCITSTLSGS